MSGTRTETLADVCESITYGLTASADFAVTSGPKLLRITDITDDGVEWESVPHCAASESEEVNCSLRNGDIVVARTGGTVGKSFLITAPPRAVNASYLLRLRPNLSRIVPEYLSQFLHSGAYWSQLMESARGAAQPNVNATTLSQICLPVPQKINHQLEISIQLKSQLTEAETARRAVKAQLAECAAMKSRALESVFNSVPDQRSIGSVAKVQSGFAFKSSSFQQKGVRLLRNTNVLPGRVYWDESVFLNETEGANFPDYVLNAGDVLISLDRPIISTGTKVARVGDVDLPSLLVQRVGRFLIDSERLDADYLFAYLQTDSFASKISGHDQSLGVPHISPSQVEALQLPLPSLRVQKRLAKRLNEIAGVWDEVVSAIHAQMSDLKRLPSAILARSFGS